MRPGGWTFLASAALLAAASFLPWYQVEVDSFGDEVETPNGWAEPASPVVGVAVVIAAVLTVEVLLARAGAGFPDAAARALGLGRRERLPVIGGVVVLGLLMFRLVSDPAPAHLGLFLGLGSGAMLLYSAHVMDHAAGLAGPRRPGWERQR